MSSTTEDTKIANILKKWLKTVQELKAEKTRLAISITRLTSIKSLCRNRKAAEQFALYMADKVREAMEAPCPEHFEETEWEAHKTIVREAIAMMKEAIDEFNKESERALEALRKRIDSFQGDDYRNVSWTTVRFVRSGNLLKLDYAIQCFIDSDYEYWVYKLAREYAEGYEPSRGTGLIPSSVPMLLDIAEFWCQYYFDCSLRDRFPKLMPD